MTSSTAEIIKTALSKYNSYGVEWIKDYFDTLSGGYNVYHKQHKFSTIEGGGDAEKRVGFLLAKYNGKQVEFLPEGSLKSPDLRFDGQTWDIKFINKANEDTIRQYIRDARKADNALFYFTNDKYEYLLNSANREIGRMTKLNSLSKIPDIYYIGEKGILTVMWKK